MVLSTTQVLSSSAPSLKLSVWWGRNNVVRFYHPQELPSISYEYLHTLKLWDNVFAVKADMHVTCTTLNWVRLHKTESWHNNHPMSEEKTNRSSSSSWIKEIFSRFLTARVSQGLIKVLISNMVDYKNTPTLQ